MAFILKDRVKESTTTTGTGNISLGGALATFDTFQTYLSNGDTTFYAIAHTSSGVDEWEVGLGTWNTGNTLTRTTVLAGSNSTSAVTFSAGTKDVFMTYPASKAIVSGEDAAFANITVTGTVDGRDIAADGTKLDGVEASADVTDTANVTSAGALMRSGGTMTGNLVLNANPSAALGAATKQYVDTEVSSLVDSAPSTLDTLNELAAALGDDANFSTTVTNSIATKLPLAGGTMTGALNFSQSASNTGRKNVISALHTSNNTFEIQQFGFGHANAPRVNQIAASNAEQHIHIVTDASATVDAGTSTKGIFLRSGGNVGIGTQSPAGTLHLHSADTALRLTSSQGSNTPLAQLQYSSSGGYFLRMGDSANNEDVMIRTYGNSHFNGGNVLVGKTSSSATTQGIQLNADGRLWATATENDHIFNRRTSDGGVISVRKDGVEVGSISVGGGNAEYRSASALSLRPNSGTSATGNIIWGQGNFKPWNSSYFDLGDSTYKWKDLHLSGQANINSAAIGTASGNPTGSHDPGCFIADYGQINIHRDGGNPLRLGNSVDGNLTEYYRQGALVGTVSVSGGDNLKIGASTADHGGLEFATHIVAPLEAGSASDGTISLGASSARFSDLHLSGAVNAATGTYAGSGTASSPTLAIDVSSSSAFVHSQENLAANLASTQTNIIVIGKEGSTKNSGYLGFNWTSAGSNSNYVSLGHWGNNNLFRVYGDGTLKAGTNTIWHQGNDGSGSGLDADLLDGVHGSSFLRSDADDSATGFIDFTTGSRFGAVNVGGVNSSGTSYNRTIQPEDNSNLYLNYDGGGVVFTNNANSSGYLQDNQSVRAPIFYDSNDTAYYVNPNSTSSMWNVNIRGDSSSTNTSNQIFFWGNGSATTSAIGFKANGGDFTNPTGNGDGYNTYLTMDTVGRGWVFRQGTGGTNFAAAYTSGWILNNGIWQANASMRSPIFYDSANTSYYVDPASTSVVNQVIATNIEFGDSTGPILSQERDQNLKLQGSTGTDVGITGYTSNGNWALQLYGHQSGQQGFLKSNWGSWAAYADNGGNWFGTTSVRAPIFYDTDDTTYYLNPASTGSSVRIKGNIDTRTQNSTTQNNQLYFGIYNGNSDGTSNEIGTGITWAPLYTSYSKRSAGILQIGEGNYFRSGLAFYTNNTADVSTDWSERMRLDMDGNLINYVSVRAPIYYDSNNTSYYVHADGTSNIYNLQTANQVVIGGTFANNNYSSVSSTRLTFGGGANITNYYIGTNMENFGGNYTKLDLAWHTGIRMGAQQGYGGVRIFDSEALGTRLFSVGEGDTNVRVSNTLYAGNLYDLNDTAYYVDPATLSRVYRIMAGGSIDSTPNGTQFSNVLGAVTVGGQSGRACYFDGGGVGASVWWGNGNSPYGAIDADQANGLRLYYNNSSGSWSEQFRVSDGYTYAINQSRAPIFYDSNDTAYYVNPADTTLSAKFRQVVAIGDGSASANSGTWGARLNLTDQVHSRIDVQQDANSMVGTMYVHQGHAGPRIGSTTAHPMYMMYNGAAYGYWDAGQLKHDASVRSPIFYDSNDTTYYLDPASTSDSALRVRGGALFGGNTTWGDFLMVGGDGRQNYVNNTTTASVATTDGNLHLDAASGHDTYINYYDGNNVYFGNGSNGQVGKVTNAGVAQFNSFTDNNNTAYYVDPATLSRVYRIMAGGSIDSTPNGTQFSNVLGAVTVGGQSGRACYFDGGGVGASVWWGNGNSPYGAIDADQANGLRLYYNNSSGSWSEQFRVSDGYAVAVNQIRAPIFYDTDNTGYYTNPAATSNIYSLTTASTVVIGGNFTNNAYSSVSSTRLLFGGGNDPSNYFIGTNLEDFGGNYTKLDLRWHTGIRMGAQAQYGGIRLFNNEDLTTLLFSVGKGDTNTRVESGSFYAPIFYDSTDTTYYVDPASRSVMGSIDFNQTISETSQGGRVGRNHAYNTLELQGYGAELMIGAQGTSININYRSCNNGTSGHTPTQWYWRAGTSTNWSNHSFGSIISYGILTATSDVRAPVFYDSDNTGYFTNPAGYSKVNSLLVGNQTTHNANTTYGLQVHHNNRYLIALNYSGHGGNHPWLVHDSYDSTGAFIIHFNGVGDKFQFTQNGNGFAASSFRAPVFYDSSNTSYYFDGSATGDSIRVAGNIVAYYSDERLKDIEGNIDSPLEKVSQLNGFYYTANKKAQTLGYKDNRQVGVSAQEVEAVMPEIVTDAAIGHGYKTVDYAKLVPLLIEAVKEQQDQIETLKSRLEKLEN